MTWAVVLGGAQNVWDDLKRATELLGEPDITVAVKDIGITYPKYDYWVTFHVDRVKRELQQRRNKGLPDPKAVWTYRGVKIVNVPIPVEYMKLRGGSSGLLGAFVGIHYCDKAVLCGIPLDPDMRHYHDRKGGKPWREADLYWPHWQAHKSTLQDRVKSMSGRTKGLLGEPTKEWLFGNAERTGSDQQNATASGPAA